MPVPKQRHSKSRKRTKHAKWKLKPQQLTSCTNCGTKIIPHRMCPECGYYKNKPILTIKVKEKKTTENKD